MAEIIVDIGDNLVETVGCDFKGVLVRCKECAKRMRGDCPMCNGCKLDRVPTEDDDYCSYGERREP